MPYILIEPSDDLEIDYRVMLAELSLLDLLQPTNLIEIPLSDDEWAEIRYYDAMGRYYGD